MWCWPLRWLSVMRRRDKCPHKLCGHLFSDCMDGWECDVPGQEFADAVDWVVGDAFEDVVEVELGVELVELGCAEQGVDGGGAFSSGV